MKKLFDDNFKNEMREKAKLSTGLQSSDWEAISEVCKREVYEDYLLNELTTKKQKMIEVTKAEWNKISKDYKGGTKGNRSVFGGCIRKNGGTTLLAEGADFIIV